jgi:small multidrug resistance pump
MAPFMNQYAILSMAIMCEVIATTALKASSGFTRLWPSVIVVVGYGAAFYFFSLTLRTIPIGIAYAIWAGFGIVLVALSGAIFFHQKMDVPAMVGIALIIAGAAVINLLSKINQ